MSSNDQPALVSSDFNLKKLNTKELSDNLEYSIKIGTNVAVIGRRGSGKTEIAKQKIRSSGRKEVYINLSVAERTDMGGYPDMFNATKNKSDAEHRFVNMLFPQTFKPLLEGNERCVALLDEVDKADPSIWAPLLEFTQYKSINGIKFKNLDSVIMTGNLIAEGGKRPSLPLLDRAEKYLVEADVNNWLSWAGESGCIHPAITAYVNDHPNNLFGPVDSEENYADPSPRGWYNASQALFHLEQFKAPKELLVSKVSGFIGKQVGLQFDMYYNYYADVLPMINQLFAGEPTDELKKKYAEFDTGKKLVTCMIACGRLGTQLDAKKPEETAKYLSQVGKFMVDTSPENILIAVRSQLGVQRIAKWCLNEDKIWKEVLGKVTGSIKLS